MRKTIKYFLNKRKLFIGVSLGITLLFTLVNVSNRVFYYEMPTGKTPFDMPFGFLYVFGVIFSSFIPVMEFKFKTNKIMVDQAYSLPVKRERYYLAKYVVGLIETLFPLVVCGLVSFLYVMCSKHIYNLWYVLPYLLMLLLITAGVYSIFVFFFIKGNTVFDGIVNMFFISCFLMALTSAIDAYVNVSKVLRTAGEYFIFAPFNNIYVFFNNLVKGGTVEEFTHRYGFGTLIPALIYIILGVVSVFGIILASKNEKAEDATQISNSYFSYRTFIPTYLFLIMIGYYVDVLLYVLVVLTAGFIGYIMYRKTVKIKKIDIIILFSSTLAGFFLWMFLSPLIKA